LDAISKKIEDLKTTLVTENSQDSEDLKQAKADLNKLDKEKLPERLKQLSSEEGARKLFGSLFNTLKEASQLFGIRPEVKSIQMTITDEIIKCFSSQEKPIDVELSGKIATLFKETIKKNDIVTIEKLLSTNEKCRSLEGFFNQKAWNLQDQRKLFSVDAITLDIFFKLEGTSFAVPDFVLEGKTRPTADELAQAKEKRELARQKREAAKASQAQA